MLKINAKSKVRVLEVMLLAIFAFVCLRLDAFLSTKFGILSEPIVYDGIAYCLNGENLWKTYGNLGFLEMLKHAFSMREPLFLHIIAAILVFSLHYSHFIFLPKNIQNQFLFLFYQHFFYHSYLFYLRIQG